MINFAINGKLRRSDSPLRNVQHREFRSLKNFITLTSRCLSVSLIRENKREKKDEIREMANQISSKLGSWKFQAHRRPFPMKLDTHYHFIIVGCIRADKRKISSAIRPFLKGMLRILVCTQGIQAEKWFNPLAMAEMAEKCYSSTPL